MTSTRPPSHTYTTSRPTTAQSRTIDPSTEPGDSICAILQSRQGGEIGAVAYNQDYSKVTVTQYTDTSTFVKTLTFLQTNSPFAVLVPPAARPSEHAVSARTVEGAVAGRSTATSETTLLVRTVQAAFPQVSIIPVSRKYWEEQAGYEFLVQLSARDHERTNTIMTSKPKYYALSAICALFKYLDSTGTAFLSPHSLKIRYAPFEGTCLIDSESAKNLELVQNVLNSKSKQHLLGMLNKCYTTSGTRMLRASILAPSTDPELVMGRYEAVDELIRSEERLRNLRKALEPLKHLDLDKITSKILSSTSSTKLATKSSIGRSTSSSARLMPKTTADPSNMISQKLTYLLTLRTFLLSLPSLRTSLENVHSSLLAQILEVFEDERLGEIRKTVEENVNSDLWNVKEPVRKGRGGGGEDVEGTRKLTKASRLFAIRAEKKLLLDVARETYRENLNDVNELQDSLRTTTGLDLTLVNTAKGEFLLQCTKESWAEKDRDIHRQFTSVNEKGKNVQFATLELQKRNARISESITEIHLLSDEILDEIFEEIRMDVGCLYRCAEAVALVDMLASFADTSSKHEYVRPELTDTLAIKAGRHPLHEYFRMSDGSFVPNDTYANESTSFQIITGSNMSGKSTLLRQIALLHVMAQIGCFVPATYASFRPVSALLTRLSNDDNFEASLSTFAQEMVTMSMVLGALEASDQTKPCLVIVDELGRGTSPDEGIGIAHAVAEEIIKSKAICFFATHFKELATTLSRFPNVVSLHLETEIDRSQADYSLTFHHILRDGTTPLVHYGLELAKIAKLPSPMIDKAHIVSSTLDTLVENRRLDSSAYHLSRRKRELLSLKASLRDLAESRIVDGSVLFKMLKDLQKDAITMLGETSLAVERVESVGELDQAYTASIAEEEGDMLEGEQEQYILSHDHAEESGKSTRSDGKDTEMDIEDEAESQDGKGRDAPQQDEEMLEFDQL